MKYAIYDRSTNSYLTKMVFEGGYSNDTQFTCGLTEYITDAQLLDTKEEAVAVVTRIESFKFMETGRFVMHSFDETLDNQYIISEAGNPTKVVDNITVDLDGTINVKYGVMPMHWSCSHLSYAVNRLNRLQEAVAPKYGALRWTFDIYKVITITDERSCTHYQFINVTEKWLDFEKEDKKNLVIGKDITDITDPLNKRIEELETSNNELRNDLYGSKHEISRLRDKIELITKEARNWKNLYENASDEREELKNALDTIRSDLLSTTACDDLKDTLNALKSNSGLDRISMDNFLTAKDEIHSIVNKMIKLMESRELTKNDDTSAENASKYHTAIANDIIDICEADDKFDITLKKFSELYEAVNDPSDDDDAIMYAFKGVLEILSSIEDHVRNIIDDGVYWKNKAKKAEKALDNQKKLNYADTDIITQMDDKLRDMVKESNRFHDNRNRLVSVIYDIRNAIYNKDSDALCRINDSIIHDVDFDADLAMTSAGGNLRDICNACYLDIQNNELKNSEIARLSKERDKALERAEFYKRQANSVYGMTIPCRCNGKQGWRDMLYDVKTGIKIPVDKKKYDDLVECVNNINTTYEILKRADFTMDKPSWFDGIVKRIKNLT